MEIKIMDASMLARHKGKKAIAGVVQRLSRVPPILFLCSTLFQRPQTSSSDRVTNVNGRSSQLSNLMADLICSESLGGTSSCLFLFASMVDDGQIPLGERIVYDLPFAEFLLGCCLLYLPSRDTHYSLTQCVTFRVEMGAEQAAFAWKWIACPKIGAEN